MRLLLNGQSIETPCAGILDLLRDHDIDPEQRGIAVAVNGQVVTRADWSTYTFNEGDEVELITAMQGG